MNTNLELYKVFYYVAKNSNITQASRELMVSQPAISKSIKVLEDELNVKLFTRKSNGVSLTNAGEILYSKIEKAMELIESAEIDIDNMNNMETGNLNIGAGNTITQNYLLPFVEEFHNMYPKINVIVHTFNTPELIKNAQIGLLDIIFTHLPNNIPNNFKVFNAKELHDILVVSKDNPLLNKTYNKKSIEKLPLILLPYNASNRKNFNAFCIKNNITINPLMEIGNDYIIRDLAKRGFGVGLVTKEYVQDELDNGTLVELNTTFSLDPKYLCYCIENTKVNNNIIKNFIKLLK